MTTTRGNAKARRERRNREICALYSSGGTLEEVGRVFKLTRERVRQILMAQGIPARPISDTKRLQRQRQIQQAEPDVCEAFRELRNVDEVRERLGLPRSVVVEIVKSKFSPAERRRERPTIKRYADGELIDFLRTTSRQLGGVLTVTAYDRFAAGRSTSDGRPWPTHQTPALRFGTWRRALEAAGLAANPSSPIAGQVIFEEGHCIDAIRALARQLRRAPTADEYERFARSSKGAMPSLATLRHKCGRWSEALRKAGL